MTATQEKQSDKEYIKILQDDINKLAKFISEHYPGIQQANGPVDAAIRIMGWPSIKGHSDNGNNGRTE
ncbi:MAG: hypothetical protein A2W17_06680 [Planctomycetes bacterium RBG_16_41_13]|nr:MAG: hypothetical protein A2W17_06680 [Planctomycetes bacterium RBG_16_41_13]